jgi:hypothetical protein
VDTQKIDIGTRACGIRTAISPGKETLKSLGGYREILGSITPGYNIGELGRRGRKELIEVQGSMIR